MVVFDDSGSYTPVFSPIKMLGQPLRVLDVNIEEIGDFPNVILRVAHAVDDSIAEAFIPQESVLGREIKTLKVGTLFTFELDDVQRPRVKIESSVS